MKEAIQKCWNNVIESYFKKGLIAYERQLQVYFFMELQKALPDYLIWIEPMIFLNKVYKPTKRPTLDGKIPDMVITKGDKIKAVIELKCSPWNFVKYESDLEKLKYFEDLATKGTKVPLSWLPISSNWKIQIASEKGEAWYKFDSEVLTVFAVIAKLNAEALKPEINQEIINFMHLTHCIEDVLYVK